MRVYLPLAASLAAASARLLHSLPEDTYAFPKFRVSFLNGLPVINDTAQRWLAEGLRGGELEFLDQPWKDGNWQPTSSRKEISAGEETGPASSGPDVRSRIAAFVAAAQKVYDSRLHKLHRTTLWNS